MFPCQLNLSTHIYLLIIYIVRNFLVIIHLVLNIQIYLYFSKLVYYYYHIIIHLFQLICCLIFLFKCLSLVCLLLINKWLFWNVGCLNFGWFPDLIFACFLVNYCWIYHINCCDWLFCSSLFFLWNRNSLNYLCSLLRRKNDCHCFDPYP
jgi:hypothetical protein